MASGEPGQGIIIFAVVKLKLSAAEQRGIRSPEVKLHGPVGRFIGSQSPVILLYGIYFSLHMQGMAYPSVVKNLCVDSYRLDFPSCFSETLRIAVRPYRFVIADDSDLFPVPVPRISHIIVGSVEMTI